MLKVMPPKMADICAFAIETGMRQDEIVQLDWSCIDFTRAVATIHKTKGNKLRTVPLTPAAMAILKRQPKAPKSSIVFWKSRINVLSLPGYVRLRRDNVWTA